MIREEIRQIAQEMLNRVVDNFIVRVLLIQQQRNAWNKHSIHKKYSKTLILEWFTPKKFYKLPVSVEKKS